jgi:hypothetical protein
MGLAHKMRLTPLACLAGTSAAATSLVRSGRNHGAAGCESLDEVRHRDLRRLAPRKRGFARDLSDWFTMPDPFNAAPIGWRAVWKRLEIETLCSLDGKNFTSARQGYFAPEGKVNVGIICSAPNGPGFEAMFDDLNLATGQFSFRKPRFYWPHKLYEVHARKGLRLMGRRTR